MKKQNERIEHKQVSSDTFPILTCLFGNARISTASRFVVDLRKHCFWVWCLGVCLCNLFLLSGKLLLIAITVVVIVSLCCISVDSCTALIRVRALLLGCARSIWYFLCFTLPSYALQFLHCLGNKRMWESLFRVQPILNLPLDAFLKRI